MLRMRMRSGRIDSVSMILGWILVGFLSLPFWECNGFLLTPKNIGVFRSSRCKDCDGIYLAKKKKAQQLMHQRWLPRKTIIEDDDIFASNNDDDDEIDNIERQSILYLSSLIRQHLASMNGADIANGDGNQMKCAYGGRLAKGRFRDLAMTQEGQNICETLFYYSSRDETGEQLQQQEQPIVEGAILAMQSLLLLGMEMGWKGSPEFKLKLKSHLAPNGNDSQSSSSSSNTDMWYLPEQWGLADTRQLKYEGDVTAAVQLLAELKRKRTAQGAFDLLVECGIWGVHENLPLLRSGYPILHDAFDVPQLMEDLRDVEEMLGLRQDLTHLKVYAIDSASTTEVDDGLSLEKMEDGRERIWIHIADADHYAPRNSQLYEAAKQRASSIYLPTGSYSMFPSEIASDVMSLSSNNEKSLALSMSVCLNEDGSIDNDSLQITPSIISLDYRLTYEDVDELLEMGTAYFEEWELGALLASSQKRRSFRMSHGSSEALVPHPIPQGSVQVIPETQNDNIDSSDNSTATIPNMKLTITPTHNAGFNQSAINIDDDNRKGYQDGNPFAAPVSSASLLVTEMMILSGEGLGRWKQKQEQLKRKGETEMIFDDVQQLPNDLTLPFRCQDEPDFASRYDQVTIMDMLRDNHVGGGYCQAWYARRFFYPVKISDEPSNHYGLGLESYVQWSSPIRRFLDLQAHAAIKRYLRIEKINSLLQQNQSLPTNLRSSDIGGIALPTDSISTTSTSTELDLINVKEGMAYVSAVRLLQRQSEEYWLHQYAQEKLMDSDLECLVLACVDPVRLQYAIYIYELGWEQKYLSDIGELSIGSRITLKIQSIQPRMGLMTLTLAK